MDTHHFASVRGVRPEDAPLVEAGVTPGLGLHSNNRSPSTNSHSSSQRVVTRPYLWWVDFFLLTTMTTKKAPRLTDVGICVLNDVYERLLTMPLEQAMPELEGLGELIAHHPDLRREARALQAISDGERILNEMRARFERKFNSIPSPQQP